MRLYPYLSYAGALPFVACAGLLSLGVNSLPVLGATYDVLLVYALVINSFLAGAHWGQHIGLSGVWSWRLPVFSNISAVLLWLGFLLAPTTLLLALFILNFAAMLLIDRRLLQAGVISEHYWQTRWRVSLVVIACLLVAGFAGG